VKTRKILIIWLSSLALCVLLVLGLYGRQTLALLGAQTQTVNSGTAGQVSVEVYSQTEGLNQADIGVTNIGTSDCYVRMMVVMPNESITTTGTNSILEISGVNLIDWIKGDDGYYYYKEVLPVGGTTNFLYRLITYSNLTPDMSLDQLQIITYAEAVQSAYLNLENVSGDLSDAQKAFLQVRQ